MSEDRSEKATPRRRLRAREQGSVSRSRDFASALVVALLVGLLSHWTPALLEGWRQLLAQLLSTATTSSPTEAARTAAWATLAAAGPVLAVGWLAAVIALLLQGGVVISVAPLQPTASRLLPSTQWRQLFSLAGLARTLRASVPFAAALYALVLLYARWWEPLAATTRLSPAGLLGFAGQFALSIAWRAALIFLLWSAADYALERWRYERSLRMTRQEVLDELKDLEGHPTVRSRIRRLRRELRRRWNVQDVQRATVVVTNPEHYAVALAYRPEEMAAPVVVAKGVDALARQIQQVARWAGVPIVEDRRLARQLYHTTEVGQSIPVGLYLAVAELLAFVWRAEARWQAARAAGGTA